MSKIIGLVTGLLLLLVPALMEGQCNQPNAQFVFIPDSTQFCEGAIIEIDNQSNLTSTPSCVDSMILNWGDGSIESFSDFGNKTHVYDIPDSIACTLTRAAKYEIKLTVVYINGDDNSITKEIKINPKPVANFSIINPCINDPEACAQNNSCWDSLWNWNFQYIPDGTSFNYSEEEPCHVFDRLGMYKVTLVASNVCPADSVVQFDTATQIVYVIDTISAKASIDSLVGCDSLRVTLEDKTEQSATVILEERHWRITPNTGWIYTNGTSDTSKIAKLFFFDPGDYTIELEVKSNCNTDEKIIGQVHLVGKPFALIEGIQGGCLPHSLSPSATDIENGNDTGLMIEWHFPKGIPSTATGANPGNIQYSTVGTDTVTVTLTNACHQITYTFIINVSELALTDVNVALPSDTCAPFSVVINNNSHGGNPFWTITPNIPDAWKFINGTDAYSDDPEIIFLQAGTFSIKLSLLNVGCGSDSTWLSSNFTIFSTAIAAIAEVAPQQCVPTTIFPYNPMTTIGGDNGATINWLFPGSNTANSTLLDPGAITYSDTGDFTITLIVDNRCGMDSTTIDFHLDALQEIVFSNPDTVCSNDPPFPILVTPSNGTCQAHPAVNNCIFYPDLANDGWNVIGYEWGTGNCLTTQSDSIFVIPISVNAGPDTTVCADETIIMLAGNPASGTWSGSGVIDPSGRVDISLLIPGQTVTLTYTLASTNFSCSASDDLELTVQALPIADFIVDGSACIDSTITFTNTSTDHGQTLTCNWIFGDGNSSGDCNPVHQFDSLNDYFISLFVTSPFGCTHDTSQTIHVSAAPSRVDFALDTTKGCADLAVHISNTSVWDSLEAIQFQWDFGNGDTSSDQNPGVINYMGGRSDTSYIIHLTVASGCGGNGYVDTVKVLPQPVASFGANQNVYCSGDSVLFGNNSYGNPDDCFWDYGNGQTSTNCHNLTENLQFYFTDTTQSIYQVQLIVSNECGEDTLSKEVIVNPTDVKAFFKVNPTQVCVGDTVYFESFASDGTRLYYKFGDGNQSDEKNPKHVYEMADTFTIIQYVEGCGFDSMTRKVSVLPLPSVLFGAPDTVCMGEPILFSDSSSVNVVNREWDFGDGQTSTKTNPSHVFDTGGSYTVQLTGRANNNCSASFTKVIYVRDVFVPLFSFSDSLCSGEVTLFNVNNSIGGSCSWDFGDGNTQAGCSVSHGFDTAGVYRVRLFITDEFGCPNNQERNVFVRDTPQPDFKFTLDQPCSPAIVQFVNLSQFSNGYNWFLGDDSISTLINPIHLYEYGDTFEVRLVANNDAICYSEISKSLIVYPSPIAILNPSDTSVCGSIPIPFSDQSIGVITSYFWQFGDSTVSYDPGTNHTYDLPGTYTVRLRVNTKFCEDDTIGTVHVFEPVSTSFVKSDLLCFGDSDGEIMIEVLSGIGPFEFDWSNGAMEEQIIDLSAGDYIYTITDSVGCQDSNTVSISQPPPIAYETLESSIVTCFGGEDGSIQVAAQGGTPGYEYVFLSSNPNGMVLSEDSILQEVPAGNYVLKIIDQNACEQIDTLTVYQNDLILAEVMLDQISCFGLEDGKMEVTKLTGGLSPYPSILLIAGNDSLEGGRVLPTFPNLSANIYTLLITDSLNCKESFEFEIIEPDSIYISIGEEDQTIILGDSLWLWTDYIADEPVFLWSPTKGLSDPESDAPFALPFETTVYQVSMTDRYGCKARDTIRLVVDIFREVYIPNAFTPNADELNDVFRIMTTAPAVTSVEVFRIFDRWGAMLFEAKDYNPKDPDENAAWDGSFRGRDLPTGQYMYYAEINFIDGKKLLFEGEINLIR